jgi:hypothetical protein
VSPAFRLTSLVIVALLGTGALITIAASVGLVATLGTYGYGDVR